MAVKLLAPYLASSGSARSRFAREARAAAAVVDDHVVPIHNVETDGEHPFLVMKFIAGGSLQQRIDREGPLEVCEVLRIGMQTAKGLAAAHAQGLIHRDVKPSNGLTGTHIFFRWCRREASGVPVFGTGSSQQNARSVDRTRLCESNLPQAGGENCLCDQSSGGDNASCEGDRESHC